MNSRIYRIFSQSLIVIVATFTLAACSSNGGSFPQVANPPPYDYVKGPPFDYVDGEELRSRMQQLAYALQKLDRALATEEDERPSFQQSVVDQLRNIEHIGERLQSGDLSSKHQFLADNMDRFLADVGSARTHASLSSPRYYMAGRIAGACINCHKMTL
jgi:hypothetical protein